MAHLIVAGLFAVALLAMVWRAVRVLEAIRDALESGGGDANVVGFQVEQEWSDEEYVEPGERRRTRQ